MGAFGGLVLRRVFTVRATEPLGVGGFVRCLESFGSAAVLSASPVPHTAGAFGGFRFRRSRVPGSRSDASGARRERDGAVAGYKLPQFGRSDVRESNASRGMTLIGGSEGVRQNRRTKLRKRQSSSDP